MALPAQKGQGWRCIVCGAVYRSEGMAEKCMRTAQCRAYNMPPRARRELWALAGGVASLGFFYSLPAYEHYSLKNPHWYRSAVLRAESEVIFDWLFAHAPLCERIRRKLHQRIMDRVAHIWQPATAQNMCFVGEIISTVLRDAHAAACQRGYAAELTALLGAVVASTQQFYEAYDPDSEGIDRLDDVLRGISLLQEVLIGHKPAPRPLSLYVVDDWQLVVARGRDEARRVLAGYGKTKPRSIKGIASGEKFADGRTAAEIIKGWDKPDVIGEVEA